MENPKGYEIEIVTKDEKIAASELNKAFKNLRKIMETQEIETNRVAGDITLVLQNGTEEEKQSMARLLKQLRPDDYKNVLASYGIEGI